MTQIVYPTGPVGNHGRFHIRKGDKPSVSLISPNGQIIFWLMGGQSIADPMRPESVQIESLTGLIPPWESIEQQGATEDGSSFVDALYGPMDITMKVSAIGRDDRNTRRVVRHLFEALDIKSQSELGWMTHELGYWWALLRWQMRPPDKYDGHPNRQQLTLQLRANSAFWQSYPDLDQWEFVYDAMKDTFDVDYSDVQNVGPNWPMLYTGNGVGYLYTDGRDAKWRDDPDTMIFTSDRSVIAGPYKDYTTSSDVQDVSIVMGSTPEFALGSGAGNDIWCRMGKLSDGTWDGNGVRARIGYGYCRISVFRNYSEVKVLGTSFTFLPPLAGNKYTLKALSVPGGGVGDRIYRLVLDGWDIDLLYVTDTSHVSLVGSAYRGVGFGMQGGAAVITEATPGTVREVYSSATLLDTFGTVYTTGLGANWPLRYEGRNDAYIRTNGSDAYWVDNSGTATQELVCGPYRDFDTDTDNQVVTMTLGSYPQMSAPESGTNDVWARMGRKSDGTWDGNGIRMRCAPYTVSITAFVNYAAVWTRDKKLFLPPGPGDKWTLVAGYTGDKRIFKVRRNGSELLSHKEIGTASHVGGDYRGVGFGVRAGGSTIGQATPAIVRKIAAGDNAEVAQSGFLERHNAGDQPAYDEYTLYGPATKFSIANGPGATDFVEFGPLAEGEIAHIRTDPRRKAVFDYSQITGATTAPVLFGAKPSDTMYRKMTGRFTSECAIPPKEPGMRVQTYHVAFSITGGNADTKIMAQLTPLRRYPE